MTAYLTRLESALEVALKNEGILLGPRSYANKIATDRFFLDLAFFTSTQIYDSLRELSILHEPQTKIPSQEELIRRAQPKIADAPLFERIAKSEKSLVTYCAYPKKHRREEMIRCVQESEFAELTNSIIHGGDIAEEYLKIEEGHSPLKSIEFEYKDGILTQIDENSLVSKPLLERAQNIAETCNIDLLVELCVFALKCG